MYNLILAFVMVFVMAAPALAAAPAEPPFFPLTKGTYWVYQGTTKWQEESSEKVSEKVLTWKMEVTETIERGHVTAAVLKGHPLDLAWYKEGKTPGDYLIIRVGPDEYYLLTEQRVQEALTKLRDQDDILADLVKDVEQFLDLPLTPGKIFGETMQITRQDGSYYWIVENEKPVKMDKVKGLSPSAALTEYELAFLTTSDNTKVNYVPGVGIVRYTYGHNGSVSETDLKLIEYHPGS